MKNIFIIGPVASGKNSLMKKIIENYDVTSLDTGEIYRYVTYKIYSVIKEKINIKSILEGNQTEINNVNNLVFHLTQYYSDALTNLSIESEQLYENGILFDNDNLYKKEVNALLPTIAKISTVRNKINDFIDNNVTLNDKPIIMTGHNLKEIDTTKFFVVYLDVDSKIASYRLYNRNKESYDDVIDAYEEVIRRNASDKIDITKSRLSSLYGYTYIDTTSKTVDDIYNEFIESLTQFENRTDEFIKNQENSIDRDKFEWIFNPVLIILKEYLENISSELLIDKPYINKNDLIYHSLIILTFFDLSDLFVCDEQEYNTIEDAIMNRVNNGIIERIKYKIQNNEVIVNKKILKEVIEKSILDFMQLYDDEIIRNTLEKYNNENSKSTLKNKNGILIKCNNGLNMDDKLEFKKINSEMSKFISKYCHYLHTPREFVSYGAFMGDNKYPIAYVSFSKHDREYKKELLYNIGIEPQNSIEMTRAWCANSAPSNIMSSLFQYSINDIYENWKEGAKEGIEEKYLQAVTTTINPNLGFKASSFFGCNFVPIALRPAKFTFVEKNGTILYKTRRSINSDETYYENSIDVLPLNELILCLDKDRMKKVLDSNILIIEKNQYEDVLKNNKKKVMKYEKNINSD